MAKARRSNQTCCGYRCGYAQVVFAWVALLGLTVVLVNFYVLHPILPVATHPRTAEGPAAVAVPVDAASAGSQDEAPPSTKRQQLRGTDEVPKLGSNQLPPLQDNCPRPPMRPSDSEQAATPGLEVMPGAGPGRWHGRLGLGPDGEPRVKPTPLPRGSESREAKREAHMGQCYNAVMSDSLPLDRDQPDDRPPKCKLLHRAYPKDLPRASVVIVFHNEIASALLRSVHSVLNQSPPDLLLEVIMVDDNSIPDPGRFTQERWQRLQGPLADYVKLLPKVQLVRLGERRGLMLARMEGAWRAKGEVVVFLDSHIEASPGWLEPMLARIHQDRRHVVVPNILGIDFDRFNYQGSSGLGVLSFSWTLGQRPQPVPGNDPAEFHKSPIMAGGLFASDRAFFMHLGGYDPEMKFYGGEEMEIGFRTWQCGGDIEFVPCSRVYHIFRSSQFWQGTDSAGVAYKVPGHEITRNKLRAAAVWMDEFEPLVQYASPPLPEGETLGDLQPRKELRQRLQCKSFKWYLETVARDVFVPKIDGMRAGALRNKYLGACFDTLGGDNPGLYPCHGQHGSQGLVMDGDGAVRIPVAMYEKCLTFHKKSEVKLSQCKLSDSQGTQQWSLDASGAFRRKGVGGGTCLEAASTRKDRIPFSIRVAPCEDGKEEQEWEWQSW